MKKFYAACFFAVLLMSFHIHGFQFFIKTPTGRTITLEGEPDMGVTELKNKISQQFHNIPIDRFRLVFQGRDLDSFTTLEEAGVGKESTIHMDILFDSGAGVRQQLQNEQKTLNEDLYRAILQGNISVVEPLIKIRIKVGDELIQAGAKDWVNVKVDGIHPALHFALLCRQWLIAYLLMKNNADVNELDDSGQAPLDIAAGLIGVPNTEGCTDIIKMLIAHGAQSERAIEQLKNKFHEPSSTAEEKQCILYALGLLQPSLKTINALTVEIINEIKRKDQIIQILSFGSLKPFVDALLKQEKLDSDDYMRIEKILLRVQELFL